MPKRKRTEKEVVKLLAAAGKATGQKTITQSMFRQFSSSKTPVFEDNAETKELETESQVNSDDCRVCSVADISYEQNQHDKFENRSVHQSAATTSSSTSGFEEDVWVRNKTDFTETDKINSEIVGKKVDIVKGIGCNCIVGHCTTEINEQYFVKCVQIMQKDKILKPALVFLFTMMILKALDFKIGRKVLIN